MEAALLAVMLSMFATFVTTGLVFFKKGQHTLAWYLTLLPFVVMACLLVAFYLGKLPTAIATDALLYRNFSWIAAVLTAGALLVFGSALGAHRERIPMWHQQEDKPQRIVEWGVYRYIRHPFYTSYCLYMIACSLAAPAYAVWCTAAYCLLALNMTAAREERELLGVFGADYARFMLRTGRFFPRFGR